MNKANKAMTGKENFYTWIWKYIRKDIRTYIKYVILAPVVAAEGVLMTMLFQSFIDMETNNMNLELALLIAVLIILFICGLVITHYMSYAYLTAKKEYELQKDILNYSSQAYDNKEKFQYAFDNDAAITSRLFTITMTNMAIQFLTLAFTYIYLGYINKSVLIIGILVSIIVPFFTQRLEKIIIKYENERRGLEEKVISLMHEYFRKIELIWVYDRIEYFRENIINNIKHNNSVFKKTKGIENNYLLMLNSTKNIILYALLFYGLVLYSRNRVSIGEVRGLLIVLPYAFTPWLELSELFFDVKKSILSAKNIHEIMHCTDHSEGSISINNLVTVEVDNVLFDNGNTISLKIHSNGLYGLTGPSGCGKTRLINTLLGIEQPLRGEIKYNDINIRNIIMSTLYKQVAYMDQDNLMFSDSIFFNINIGNRNVMSHKKIEQAATKANIHSEIMSFENGYETSISDNGRNISGGQKQRICFARTILKNADFYILDEPLSNLDVTNKRLIIQEIKYIAKEKIVFVVSHDNILLSQCDEVFSFVHI